MISSPHFSGTRGAFHLNEFAQALVAAQSFVTLVRKEEFLQQAVSTVGWEAWESACQRTLSSLRFHIVSLLSRETI